MKDNMEENINVNKINTTSLNDFKVYTVNNVDFKVRKLSYIDGKEKLEFSVQKKSGWTTPIKGSFKTLIADLENLKDMGVYLGATQLHDIYNTILKERENLPIKLAEVNPGFNGKKEALNFQAGCTINYTGDFFRNDPGDGFPEVKGDLDSSCITSFIKNFATSVKHQLLLLHTLIAPFIALLAIYGKTVKTPIMVLNSESPREQDLASRLAISLAISPEFFVTNLDYNNRKKDIPNCLSSNYGLPIRIYNVDEKTSDSYIKLLSVFSTPQNKKKTLVSNYESKTSVLMTTAQPIFSLLYPDSLNIFSSVFPLDFKRDELFSNTDLLLAQDEYIQEHQGMVLPEIIQHIMVKTPDCILKELEEERKNINKTIIPNSLIKYNAKFSKEEKILLYEWGFYFASLKITTKILSAVYSLDWDADAIINYMLDTLIQALQEKTNVIGELIQQELYPSLLNHAEKGVTPKNDSSVLYIKSKNLGTIVKKFKDEHGLELSYTKFIDELANQKIIIPVSNNKYYKNVHNLGQCYFISNLLTVA